MNCRENYLYHVPVKYGLHVIVNEGTLTHSHWLLVLHAWKVVVDFPFNFSNYQNKSLTEVFQTIHELYSRKLILPFHTWISHPCKHPVSKAISKENPLRCYVRARTLKVFAPWVCISVRKWLNYTWGGCGVTNLSGEFPKVSFPGNRWNVVSR